MSAQTQLITTAINHHQAGRLPEAERIYRQILDSTSENPDAWHLLGVVQYQKGAFGEAIEFIHRAISLQPHVAEYHTNLGTAYLDSGDFPEAAAAQRRALELRPAFPVALNNLANALRKQRDFNAALGYASEAVRLEPTLADAHNNLGTILKELGKLDDAVGHYREAIRLNPRSAETYNNLGIHYQEQRQFDEAIRCHHRTLEINPKFAEAHVNLGIIARKQKRYKDAITLFQRALECNPGKARTYNDLGHAQRESGQISSAVASFDRALQLDSDCAEAHLNRAAMLLLTADFERGWPEYEWRWKIGHNRPRNFTQPEWDGSPLDGRTILLHAEQGLGDTIQFVRYATLLKRQGCTVLLLCQKPLTRLLGRSNGVDQLIPIGDPLPPFDVHCPLLSLPRVVQTSLRNVPADVPYVFADPQLVEKWGDRLNDIEGVRIGIVWQGNPDYPDDHFCSFPLSQFGALANLTGIRLISLQKGFGTEQLNDLCGTFAVTELGDDFDESTGAFMDTAAVMKNLELVISADTSVAHVAGALGVPVWIPLSTVCDWRWLLDRKDSPWYPSVRLFRQQEQDDWEAVFDEIRIAVQREFLAPRAASGSGYAD